MAKATPLPLSSTSLADGEPSGPSRGTGATELAEIKQGAMRKRDDGANKGRSRGVTAKTVNNGLQFAFFSLHRPSDRRFGNSLMSRRSMLVADDGVNLQLTILRRTTKREETIMRSQLHLQS